MRRFAPTTALIVLGLLLAGPAGAAQPAVGPVSAAALAAPATASATAPAAATGWAAVQIAAVVAAGVLGTDVASFRPDDPLTRGELYEALSTLGKAARPPAAPDRAVTMRELDAQLVAALGLLPAARRIRLAARDAGLQPTGMLGTETVARMLGLRLNHPQGEDELELLPTQPATRAEAAYSFARVLQLDPGSLAYVDGLSLQFVLPQPSDWQRVVLTRALRFVGYPYVWTGVSEKRQELWSATAPGGLVSAPGGFDCSGFVWRVYKLQPFPGAPLLGEMLRGRTTYAMSGEVKRDLRIPFDALEPGDIVFFGSRGTKSKPSEVSHMGIYVGGGWMVHASDNGTTLVPLQGWYATRFAWGRRPLAEAGLEG